jgi:hypothetical protein
MVIKESCTKSRKYWGWLSLITLIAIIGWKEGILTTEFNSGLIEEG